MKKQNLANLATSIIIQHLKLVNARNCTGNTKSTLMNWIAPETGQTPENGQLLETEPDQDRK
jgi:hypothetical protein